MSYSFDMDARPNIDKLNETMKKGNEVFERLLLEIINMNKHIEKNTQEIMNTTLAIHTNTELLKESKNIKK